MNIINEADALEEVMNTRLKAVCNMSKEETVKIPAGMFVGGMASLVIEFDETRGNQNEH